jgi:hypothetical protein
MNTVTPYPTLTAFPTAIGTPLVDMAPVLDMLHAQNLGPEAVQWWQMGVAPHWAAVSLGIEIMLVMGIFFVFYRAFKQDN